MSTFLLIAAAVLVLQAVILLWPENADPEGDRIVRRRYLSMFTRGPAWLPRTRRGRRRLAAAHLLLAFAALAYAGVDALAAVDGAADVG